MDLEQPNNDTSHVTHVENYFWKKLYSRNYLPILCVIFVIIFAEYGILYQFAAEGDLVTKDTTTASNLQTLISLIKSYYGLPMYVKPIDYNTTIHDNDW